MGRRVEVGREGVHETVPLRHHMTTHVWLRCEAVHYGAHVEMLFVGREHQFDGSAWSAVKQRSDARTVEPYAATCLTFRRTQHGPHRRRPGTEAHEYGINPGTHQRLLDACGERLMPALPAIRRVGVLFTAEIRVGAVVGVDDNHVGCTGAQSFSQRIHMRGVPPISPWQG